jgi:hypothetical protein
VPDPSTWPTGRNTHGGSSANPPAASLCGEHIFWHFPGMAVLSVNVRLREKARISNLNASMKNATLFRQREE